MEYRQGLLYLLMCKINPFCRPSTPIFDLLENKYQERWLLERKDAEKKARDDIRQRVNERLLVH